MSRIKTIIAFCIVSALMVCGAKALLYNLTPMFDEVNKSIGEGNTIVMNGKVDAQSLKKILLSGDYVEDERDADFVSGWYARKIAKSSRLENLGALRKDDFKIPYDTVMSDGGKGLKERLKDEAEKRLGQDEAWKMTDPASLQQTFVMPDTHPDSLASIPVMIVREKNSKDSKSLAGVTVRLTEHFLDDSIKSAKAADRYFSRVVGFAKTDENGRAVFKVPKGKFYSALPIQPGYQFGREKGTRGEELSGDIDVLTFVRKPHMLIPLSDEAYRNMKSEKVIISRTPAEFTAGVWKGIGIFLVSWMAVFASTMVFNRRRGRRADSMLLVALMAISGLGMLTLYGQMLPLTDIFNAYKMVDVLSLRPSNFSGGIVLGCAALIILSNIDWLKMYQKYRQRFKGKSGFGQSAWSKMVPGLPFVVLAVLLMILLRLFGTAPEGSDAKVNLLGFQPSEVIKYLVVIFMAFFFVANGDLIRTFGTRLTKLARKKYLSIIGGVLAVIALICFIFLAVLKDMGPGIVILATFIMLYSVTRRDFPQLLLGIISFVTLVGIVYILTPSPLIRICAVAVWFAGWILWSWKKNHTVYESAIFFNVLISFFLIGGYLLQRFLPHMAERLNNRTGMAWSGIFDNAVPLGDQIAQGLWGTAAGGFSGMGFGGGSPYFIPAGHTDMILSSLGEQAGWLGILIVIVCFYILVSRTAMAAQYSGHRFTFYLCLGLGLLTGVQFLFIALGSVGALPLSGIPVPFMSYTGTGMMFALASYGIVISISRHKGSREALREFVVDTRRPVDARENVEARNLDNNLFAGMTLFFVGVLCVAAFNGYYQIFASDKTQLRPAVTATASGLKVMDYNPRISQLLNRLERGNIYDRNGLLLATSNRENLKELKDSLALMQGLPLDSVRRKMERVRNKHLKRYYPFGNEMVFLVGDINRPDIYTNYGDVIGYFAEIEHLDLLRGLDMPEEERRYLRSEKYRVNRFMAPVTDSTLFTKRDYSVLLPGLSMPLYRNSWVEEYNGKREQRDIRLTADAALQTALQTRMAQYIKSDPNLSSRPDLRASVVVLDAGNGDLLTSSNYPLPQVGLLKKEQETYYDFKRGLLQEYSHNRRITDRDLGMTYQTQPGSTAKVMSAMAGFSKLGPAAYDRGFEIEPYMTVEPSTSEPNTSMPSMNRGGGQTTYLENAIKYSSNCYFVMLVNEEDLYSQLGDIYWTVGASLNGSNPYFFYPREGGVEDRAQLDRTVNSYHRNGLTNYRNYMHHLPPKGTPRVGEGKGKTTMSNSTIQKYTSIAWGQDEIKASPLNMARVTGIVANNGRFASPRYLLGQPAQEPVQVIDAASAGKLASAMGQEASKWTAFFPGFLDGAKIGGKTGTPERGYVKGRTKSGRPVMGTQNDAWYMCFIRDVGGRNLAVAVRLERVGGMKSTEAAKFMGKVVMQTLADFGYLD